MFFNLTVRPPTFGRYDFRPPIFSRDFSLRTHIVFFRKDRLLLKNRPLSWRSTFPLLVPSTYQFWERPLNSDLTLLNFKIPEKFIFSWKKVWHDLGNAKLQKLKTRNDSNKINFWIMKIVQILILWFQPN